MSDEHTHMEVLPHGLMKADARTDLKVQCVVDLIPTLFYTCSISPENWGIHPYCEKEGKANFLSMSKREKRLLFPDEFPESWSALLQSGTLQRFCIVPFSSPLLGEELQREIVSRDAAFYYGHGSSGLQ